MTRRRRSDEELLQELVKKQAEQEHEAKLLKAKIAAKKKAIREKKDKHRTHCMIVAGSLATNHMTKNPESEFARVLLRLLDEYVEIPKDRDFFELDIKQSPPPVPSNDSNYAEKLTTRASDKFATEAE